MWTDLKEHFGTVIFLLGAMAALCVTLLGVIWSWLRNDMEKFPAWLAEIDKEGGVVTHRELNARAIGLTETEHKSICREVTIMVLARVDQSEKHQKELMEAFSKQFRALLEGQQALIKRLQDIQDLVLNRINSRILEKDEM